MKICKIPQKFLRWRCLKCEIGMTVKAAFKTNVFKKSLLTKLLRPSDNMFKSWFFIDFCGRGQRHRSQTSEAFRSRSQTSEVELFAKILKAVNYFHKRPILDV